MRPYLSRTEMTKKTITASNNNNARANTNENIKRRESIHCDSKKERGTVIVTVPLANVNLFPSGQSTFLAFAIVAREITLACSSIAPTI